MTKLTSIVEALVAHGATPETILVAIRAAELHDDNALEKRRASDRARQAKRRSMSRDVRVTHVTHVTAPLPDKEIPPTPPKETNPTPIQNEETNVSSQKRGSRIPDDFEPDLIWAQSQGLSPSQASSEALKFRDYWRGKTQNATKLDWPATWRNWVRAALERLPQARASPAAFPAKDTTANAANRRLELIRNERTRSEIDDYQPAVGLISRYPERGVG